MSRRPAASRLDNFRRVFMVALKEVLTVYKSAKIDLHDAREAACPKVAAGGMVLSDEPRDSPSTTAHRP